MDQTILINTKTFFKNYMCEHKPMHLGHSAERTDMICSLSKRRYVKTQTK